MIDQSHIFYEIPKSKLKQIFEVVGGGALTITKDDVSSIFEALFDQVVASFEVDALVTEDYEVVVENFKCIYRDFSDKKKLDNISRRDLQDGKLTSGLRPELQAKSCEHLRTGTGEGDGLAR